MINFFLLSLLFYFTNSLLYDEEGELLNGRFRQKLDIPLQSDDDTNYKIHLTYTDSPYINQLGFGCAKGWVKLIYGDPVIILATQLTPEYLIYQYGLQTSYINNNNWYSYKEINHDWLEYNHLLQDNKTIDVEKFKEHEEKPDWENKNITGYLKSISGDLNKPNDIISFELNNNLHFRFFIQKQDVSNENPTQITIYTEISEDFCDKIIWQIYVFPPLLFTIIFFLVGWFGFRRKLLQQQEKFLKDLLKSEQNEIEKIVHSPKSVDTPLPQGEGECENDIEITGDQKKDKDDDKLETSGEPIIKPQALPPQFVKPLIITIITILISTLDFVTDIQMWGEMREFYVNRVGEIRVKPIREIIDIDNIYHYKDFDQSYLSLNQVCYSNNPHMYLTYLKKYICDWCAPKDLPYYLFLKQDDSFNSNFDQIKFNDGESYDDKIIDLCVTFNRAQTIAIVATVFFGLACILFVASFLGRFRLWCQNKKRVYLPPIYIMGVLIVLIEDLPQVSLQVTYYADRFLQEKSILCQLGLQRGSVFTKGNDWDIYKSCYYTRVCEDVSSFSEIDNNIRDACDWTSLDAQMSVYPYNKYGYNCFESDTIDCSQGNDTQTITLSLISTLLGAISALMGASCYWIYGTTNISEIFHSKKKFFKTLIFSIFLTILLFISPMIYVLWFNGVLERILNDYSVPVFIIGAVGLASWLIFIFVTNIKKCIKWRVKKLEEIEMKKEAGFISPVTRLALKRQATITFAYGPQKEKSVEIPDLNDESLAYGIMGW